MPKKLIIHAGMHKTGSSSIQASFAALNREGLTYAPYTAPNHSGLFEYLTSEDLRRWRIARRRGTSRKELKAKQTDVSDAFTRFLQDFEGIGILSGERMSGLKSRERLERLVEIVTPHVSDIDVMIYVRAPVSYMQSAFQQRLKAEGAELNMRQLYPNYRKRFQPFFDVFGAENITLRAFHPWKFPDKDVVQDFAQFVGTTLSQDEIIKKNESLSAEASALLYVVHKLRLDAETDTVSIGRRRRFIAYLNQELGREKFYFAPALTERVIRQEQADIAWVEGHLGCKLEERPSHKGYEIRSKEDFITLGFAQLERLEALLDKADDTIRAPMRKQMQQLLEAARTVDRARPDGA